MTTLMALGRTRSTAVWLALVSATMFSWWLGTGHGRSTGGHQLASSAIIVIAFIKVRFIGMYFMELRRAPLWLRGLFDAYCLTTGCIVFGMYLWA